MNPGFSILTFTNIENKIYADKQLAKYFFTSAPMLYNPERDVFMVRQLTFCSLIKALFINFLWLTTYRVLRLLFILKIIKRPEGGKESSPWLRAWFKWAGR